MNFSFSMSRFTRLIFLFMGILFISTTLLFLFDGHLNLLNAVIILVTVFALSNYCIGLKKDSILLNVGFVICTILLILFSQFYIDLTFDGQAYHQEMMIQMSSGWNPVYELIDDANNQSIWLNHYSKGYEIIGAVFYKLLNNITYVKFINLIFLALSFLYPFNYFKEKISKKKALLIALIIAFNPVTLVQLMTNLIDGFLYSVTVITVFSYLLSKTSKAYFFDFIIGLILLMNIKFTGLVFGVALYGVILIYALFVEKIKRVILLKKTLLIILIALPFLLTPYIKNFIEKGHPFYPLMGTDKIDFVEDYVPDVIKGKGRLEKIILTNFVSIGNRSDSKLKLPFTFSLNELQKMRNGAPRVGSFGVWWGGLLLFSFMYYFISVFQLRGRFKFSIYEAIICVIILLLLINKAGWWLRYTPYFWLIPILLFLSINQYKETKNGLKILFCLVFINGFLTLIVSLGLRYNDSKEFIYKLNSLKNIKNTIQVDFGAYLGNKALFKEHKIPFVERASKTFTAPEQFNNVVFIEGESKTKTDE